MSDPIPHPALRSKDPYRVLVWKEAELDDAWQHHFENPGDTEELRFLTSLLAGLGAWPPDSEDRKEIAAARGIERHEVGGERFYSLLLDGVRHERKPPVVLFFWADDFERVLWIVQLRTVRMLRRRRAVVLRRVAERVVDSRADHATRCKE